MPIEFKLPEVSEGVESADVAELMVAEGDRIEAGQVVLEVETEKAVAEIEGPHAGRVTRVHVAEGETIPVGAVLLTVAEETEAGTEPPAPPPSETSASVAEPAEAETQAIQEPVAKTPRPATPPHSPAKQAAQAHQRAGATPDTRPPAPAGPATRRLARQLGVDLYQVTGTGTGGRITEHDVKSFVSDRLSSTPTPVVAPGQVAVPALPDFSVFGPTERQPLNKIAQTAAANLTVSWQLVPHVTQHDLADVTDLEAARRRYVQSVPEGTPKVTMTAIVIKAVAAALETFPQFNASLDGAANELVLKRYYHIGCAVDTPNGLLVPVVRDVDQKSVLTIAAELLDLANRARDRKLALDDMQGATFTVSNLGGISGTAFTPIVNYPEVAILGLSRTRTELRINDDGQIDQRLLLPLSLSYDHRVINGADGARFTAKLARDLSDSFHLLVEC